MMILDANGERRLLAGAVAALLLAGLAFTLATFWPGIMVWDAIRQYGQAVSGQYDDWHPPAMNWLWRELGTFAPGPAPMLIVQNGLYWGGFALIAAALVRERRRWFWPLLIALFALMPVAIVLMGTVLKDSLMAGALLAATGLILWRRDGRGWLAVPAAALLIAAATLRFNAVPACLPLLALLLPARWAAGRMRLLGAAVVALPLLVAMPLANRMLGATPSHVELSLMIYDLGGITRFSGRNVFPDVGVADPVAINRGCYTPVSWDRYAWWGDEPCPIGFADIEPVVDRPGTGAARIWLSAIAAHPLAYAEHRLAHFNREMRFLGDDASIHGLSLQSDPNRWNYRVPPDRLRDAIGVLAAALVDRPTGWPIVWVALAAGVLWVRARGDRVAMALAASSLLYALSFLPLGVATEVRYHLWTMIAAALAALRALAMPGIDDKGRAIILVPAMATTLVAIATRILL